MEITRLSLRSDARIFMCKELISRTHAHTAARAQGLAGLPKSRALFSFQRAQNKRPLAKGGGGRRNLAVEREEVKDFKGGPDSCGKGNIWRPIHPVNPTAQFRSVT